MRRTTFFRAAGPKVQDSPLSCLCFRRIIHKVHGAEAVKETIAQLHVQEGTLSCTLFNFEKRPANFRQQIYFLCHQ